MPTDVAKATAGVFKLQRQFPTRPLTTAFDLRSVVEGRGPVCSGPSTRGRTVAEVEQAQSSATCGSSTGRCRGRCWGDAR